MREPCSASSESAQAMSAVLRQPLRPHETERAERRHELRAVHEREAFLRLQPDRLEPDRVERGGAGQQPAVDPGLALADQRQGEVGERGKVAARAHRAAARDVREDAAVQALDQQLDRDDASAGVALGERVRAQQHRRAHDLVRVRLADAAGVAAQEPQLELLGQLLGDRARDESAEAGVHAVGVLAACRARRSRRPRARHASAPARRRSARRGRAGRRRPRHPRARGRRPSAPCSRSRSRVYPGPSAPGAPPLRLEQAQLEHVRGVESVDPEGRTCRGDGGSCRHQADELGADHLRPARPRPLARRARRSRAGPPPRSPPRSCSPGRARPAAARARAPARRGSRRPLADERRDLPRGVERPRRLTLKAISGRRAPTSTPPGRSSSRAGPKSGASSPRVDPPLQLLRPAGAEERRARGHRRARRRGRPAGRARPPTRSARQQRRLAGPRAGPPGRAPQAGPHRRRRSAGARPRGARRSIRSRAHAIPSQQRRRRARPRSRRA